jgi:hypothetical protein
MSRLNINNLNAMIEKLNAKKKEAVLTLDARIEKARNLRDKQIEIIENLHNQREQLNEENK